VPTRAGRATLATIASEAGVSVATVSKVLNGRPDVAAATRSRVERVLEERSYQPRRGDRPGPSSIALLFHGPLMTYSLELLEGVLAAAADVGVDVMVARTDIAREDAARRIRERGGTVWQAVIAVTTAASELSTLSRAHVPTVVIDPMGATQPDVISVGATNFAGGLSATQHLLDLGHRRIAYVGGTAGSPCNRARLQGYRGAMEAAGARIGRGYLRDGHFAYRDGLVQGAALLDLPQPPTAIFSANDEMALGILEAARTRGVRVPQDLSVVGFDDTEVARVASPPLTTVAQPLRRMGAVALRTALRLGAGEHVDSHHVELATELVVRGSTDAPPADLAAARTTGKRRRQSA
jgi:LacI family transcriptional regulator